MIDPRAHNVSNVQLSVAIAVAIFCYDLKWKNSYYRSADDLLLVRSRLVSFGDRAFSRAAPEVVAATP